MALFPSIPSVGWATFLFQETFLLLVIWGLSLNNYHNKNKTNSLRINHPELCWDIPEETTYTLYTNSLYFTNIS